MTEREIFHKYKGDCVGNNMIQKTLNDVFYSVGPEEETWMCASDAHIMLMLRENDPVELQGLPKGPWLKGTSGEFHFLDIEKMSKVLKAVPEIPEVTYSSNSCKECGGTGYVTWTYTDSDGYEHENEFTCPVCEGIEEQHEVPTGRTFKDPSHVFPVLDTYISAKYACILANICEAAGGVSSLKFEKYSRCALRFFITENLVVVIAPIIKNDNHIVL